MKLADQIVSTKELEYTPEYKVFMKAKEEIKKLFHSEETVDIPITATWLPSSRPNLIRRLFEHEGFTVTYINDNSLFYGVYRVSLPTAKTPR